ncbi:hypothetical protein GEMRC1_008157 [Eukaryota sp. GEM-RC1]
MLLSHSLRFHSDSVSSICTLKSNPVTSSADGSVVLWDPFTHRPLQVINTPSNSTLPGGVLSVSPLDTSDELFIQHRGGQYTLFNCSNSESTSSVKQNYSGFCKAKLVDSNTALLPGSDDKSIDVVDFRLSQVVNSIPQPSENGHLSSLEFYNQYTVGVGNEAGKVTLFDLRQPSVNLVEATLFSDPVMCLSTHGTTLLPAVVPITPFCSSGDPLHLLLLLPLLKHMHYFQGSRDCGAMIPR